MAARRRRRSGRPAGAARRAAGARGRTSGRACSSRSRRSRSRSSSSTAEGSSSPWGSSRWGSSAWTSCSRCSTRTHPVRLAGFIGLAGLVMAALYGDQFQVLLAEVALIPVLFGLTLLQPRHERDAGDGRDPVRGLLDRPRAGPRRAAARAAARRGHHRRRPRRHLPRRHRRLLRRAHVRAPPAGAPSLAQQDGRGPADRDGHRGGGDVVRGHLPGLAHGARRAAARHRRRARRARGRPVRVDHQARRGDEGHRPPVRRARRRAGPPGRRAVHDRRRLLRAGTRCSSRAPSAWGRGRGGASGNEHRFQASRRMVRCR